MPDKFCSYCTIYKPASDFVSAEVRKSRTPMCNRCYESRKAHRTKAQRDAFGQTVRERNREQQSAKTHTLNKILEETRNPKNGKTI